MSELIERLLKDVASLQGVASSVYADDIKDAIEEIKRLERSRHEYRETITKLESDIERAFSEGRKMAISDDGLGFEFESFSEWRALQDKGESDE